MSNQVSGINIATLKRDLTLRISLLLSLFLILSITSYVFASRTITAKESDSVIINIAGRQRMLIRQYTSEVSQVLIGLATSNFKMVLSEKKKVDSTAAIFESTHRAFIKGGRVKTNLAQHDDDVTPINIYKATSTVIPPQTEQEIIEHLNYIESEWKELKRIALLSLRADADSISKNPYVKQLLNQATIAVKEMDHVVQLMQYGSEKRLRKLDSLLLIAVLVSIVLFVFTLYFIYSKSILSLYNSILALQQTSETLKIEKLKAEKANQAKSRFLSQMSHELRTPLNAILGFAQILVMDRDQLNDIQHDSITEIVNAGYHLLNLINEVLDLAKIESNKLDVTIDDVNISKILDESLNLIDVIKKESQIEIINNISNKEYIVRSDPTRVKQVLVNLLSNAIKYNCEHGSITIDSKVINGKRLRVSITDTGKGLTQDQVSMLFTPFERLNMKDNVEGTGIGLVITKHLIELMGGTIGIESTPDKGSTFWFDLLLSGDV